MLSLAALAGFSYLNVVRFAAQAGFELKNWADLRAAIRRLADTVDGSGGPDKQLRNLLPGRRYDRGADREAAGRLHLDQAGDSGD